VTTAKAVARKAPVMIMVGKSRLMPEKITCPNPPPATKKPMVAIPMMVTVAILTPATITGSANGNSTPNKIWRAVRPMPLAASIVSVGTASRPATTLRMRTRSE
jgi:hypothetical protein